MNDSNSLELIKVSSLNEYSLVTEALEKEGWWFRGQPCASLRLLPGIYREGIFSDPEAEEGDVTFPYIYNDRQIIEKYHDYLKIKQPDISYLQAMYRAQHYGIKTRLLDFTSNKYVALFFSVAGNTTKIVDEIDDCAEFNDNYFAVFCLNPLECNKYSYGKKILFTLSELDKSKIYNNSTPLAIEPDFDNPRLKAQSGKFVIFGQRWQPLDWYDVIRKKCLKKILISKRLIKIFMEELKNIDYSYQTVYPDEEGFIKDLNFELGNSLICIKELGR